MTRNPDDKSPSSKEGAEDYTDKAARALARNDWISKYFEFAFGPIEAAYRIGGAILKAQGRQAENASAFIQEVQTQVWGPNLTLIHDIAYFMWEMAGRPPGMTRDFGLAAQRYFAAIMGLATASETTPQILMDQFSPGAYFYRVRDLAEAMSRHAGQPDMDPLAFWLSAETHVVTMLAGLAATVQNAQDAVTYLNKICTLSNDKYLRHIEEGAYYIWEMAGWPPGRALEHWLQSERAILTGIEKQISNGPLGLQ